jgi:chromosome segregation ATPase
MQGGRSKGSSWKTKLIVPVVVSVTVLIFFWVLFVRPLERKLTECDEQSESLLNSLETAQEENAQLLQVLDKEKLKSKSLQYDLDKLAHEFDQYKHLQDEELLSQNSKLSDLQDYCNTTILTLEELNSDLEELVNSYDQDKQDCFHLLGEVNDVLKDMEADRDGFQKQMSNLSHELDLSQTEHQDCLQLLDKTLKDLADTDDRGKRRPPPRKEESELVAGQEKDGEQQDQEELEDDQPAQVYEEKANDGFYDDGDDLVISVEFQEPYPEFQEEDEDINPFADDEDFNEIFNYDDEDEEEQDQNQNVFAPLQTEPEGANIPVVPNKTHPAKSEELADPVAKPTQDHTIGHFGQNDAVVNKAETDKKPKEKAH